MSVQLLPSFRGAPSKTVAPDLLAGITVWAVLIPEAMAYASIAGMSPIVGLYAAAPALVLYALFGSSRQLIVGPMAATAALSGATVAELSTNGNAAAMTAALAIMVGVWGVLAGIIKLGFLASFISEPVMKGFIIGMAISIMAGQIPKLFGLDGGSEGGIGSQIYQFVTSLGDADAWTMAVGFGSLAVVLGLRATVPRVPAPLVALVGSIALSTVLDLADKGVAVVGQVDSGFPALGLPDLAVSDYAALVGPALGTLLVGYAEGLGAARTYADEHDYRVDPNQELLGLGAANLGAGLTSGMVVNGSLSKTAVNDSAGARSQISGLIVAALVVPTLLVTSLFTNLPEATLAAVVVAAVAELANPKILIRLSRVYTSKLGRDYGALARVDLIAAVAALAGVLIFGTLAGLFIGIGVSVTLLVYRASRPNVAVLGQLVAQEPWVDVARHTAATTVAGVVVLRPEGGLFFANADNVRTAVRQHIDDTTRGVVLDLADVPVVDITAVQMLAGLDKELDRKHITMFLAHNIGQVRDLLDAADATHLLQQSQMTVSLAVAKVNALLEAEAGRLDGVVDGDRDHGDGDSDDHGRGDPASPDASDHRDPAEGG
ncbi:MAG: SulP family inorganic anion transporter [Acidimicrobiales bacterium]